MIVKLDIASYPFTQRARAFKFIDVDAFVLELSEISLCAAIVGGTALPIHGHLHTFLRQQIQVRSVGEMGALITIHNPRLTATEGTPKTREDKTFLQGAGQFIIDDFPAVPIDDVEQIHEAFAHADIGDIHTPDLIGTMNLEPTQEIRTAVLRMKPLARVWLGIDCFKAHNPHEVTHTLLIDRITLIPKDGGLRSISEMGMLRVDVRLSSLRRIIEEQDDIGVPNESMWI